MWGAIASIGITVGKFLWDEFGDNAVDRVIDAAENRVNQEVTAAGDKAVDAISSDSPIFVNKASEVQAQSQEIYDTAMRKKQEAEAMAERAKQSQAGIGAVAGLGLLGWWLMEGGE